MSQEQATVAEEEYLRESTRRESPEQSSRSIEVVFTKVKPE